MSAREIQFTFLACADIKRLWEAASASSGPWYAGDHLLSAEEMTRRLEQHCAILRDSPEVGLERDDLVHGLLSSAFGRYKMFYRVRGERVEVLRVLRADLDAPPAA